MPEQHALRPGLVKALMERSDGFCEALSYRLSNGVYRRCWGLPIQYVRLLPVSRGALYLEERSDIHHIIVMCNTCVDKGHYEPLLIDGYVTRDRRYFGSDIVLGERYGGRSVAKIDPLG